mmetsp:Transcript_112378/g.303330  ORF Transcript_112378/g.303330 Transcript_112378/m.303330 type:complete len:258 (-) Transcript_112378:209-982(-)
MPTLAPVQATDDDDDEEGGGRGSLVVRRQPSVATRGSMVQARRSSVLSRIDKKKTANMTLDPAPLFNAARAGHIRDAEAFLDLDGGVDYVDRIDAHGRTALMLACMADGHEPGAAGKEKQDCSEQVRRDIAELLIDRGASVNIVGPGGWTALFFAAFYAQEPTVRLLLSTKADVNHKDKDGRPVGSWARYGDLDAAHLKRVMKLFDHAGHDRHIDAVIKHGEVNECMFMAPIKLDEAAEDLISQALEAHGGISSVPR